MMMVLINEFAAFGRIAISSSATSVTAKNTPGSFVYLECHGNTMLNSVKLGLNKCPRLSSSLQS
jgi:hypothetical protein